MAKIKGKWMFNLTFVEDVKYEWKESELTFVSYNQAFKGILVSGDGNRSLIYYRSENSVVWDLIVQSTFHGYTNGWYNEAYRTIDFGTTEQECSDEFYAWMIKNATQQSDEPEIPVSFTKKFIRLYIDDIITSSSSKCFRKLSVEQIEPDDSGTPGLTYTLSDDGTYYTCTGIGTVVDTDIVIASKIDGLPVMDIAYSAFRDCYNLTSVTIPSSVTSIGGFAFYYCTGLTSITIPDSVTYIDSSAFEDCYSLTIYCEAASEPGGWNSYWNSSNCLVIWGYKA